MPSDRPTVTLAAHPRRKRRRARVEIVGIETDEGVHTIDIWFSARRDCWVLERHDVEGRIVGVSYCTPDEPDAAACLSEWLRTHGETHLVGRAARMVAEARARAA